MGAPALLPHLLLHPLLQLRLLVLLRSCPRPLPGRPLTPLILLALSFILFFMGASYLGYLWAMQPIWDLEGALKNTYFRRPAVKFPNRPHKAKKLSNY